MKEHEDCQREIIRVAMTEQGGVMTPRLAGRWAWTVGVPRAAPYNSSPAIEEWLFGWDYEAASGLDLKSFEERIVAEFESYVMDNPYAGVATEAGPGTGRQPSKPELQEFPEAADA